MLQVVLGTESPALAKLKANSKVTSEFFSRPSSSASVPGTVFHSGFLFKKGGSKGGRRNWTRVRDYLASYVSSCMFGLFATSHRAGRRAYRTLMSICVACAEMARA